MKKKLNNYGFGLVSMILYLSIFFIAFMMITVSVNRLRENSKVEEPEEEIKDELTEDNEENEE